MGTLKKPRIGKNQRELLELMCDGYVIRVIHQISTGHHLIVLKHENDDEWHKSITWHTVSKLEKRDFFDIEERSMCIDVDMYIYRLKTEILATLNANKNK